MINLDAVLRLSVIKIIDLDSEVGVFVVKIIAGLVIEIDDNSRYTKIALIGQNTIVLF